MSYSLLSFLVWALLVLLTSAASLDEEGPDGSLLRACLEEASEKAALAKVKEALEKGANVNVVHDDSGQTPLMGSVLRGKTEIVKYLLLQTEADPNIGEKDGYTAAHGAGFQGRFDIMRFLHSQGIDVMNDFHRDGYAPLHRACWGREERHTKTVQVLLDLGVDVNLPSKGTGLTCEDMTNNPGTIEVLKKHEASAKEPLGDKEEL